MGCICSKGTAEEEIIDQNETKKDFNKSGVQLTAPATSIKEDSVKKAREKKDGTVRRKGVVVPLNQEEQTGTVIVGRPKNVHHRWETKDIVPQGRPPQLGMAGSTPSTLEEELIKAGWPSWLTSVAAEAIIGWVPRRADSYEKLDKIGQGTYSTVYKGRDLETGKMVAMKKVRFVNMDPESVRFMAREIQILRKLDHPNCMKLEGIVTSRMSGSLYLVFEYMEHDLAGLAATPGIKFTEAQIKCYMQQFFRGLEHCHSRGILHRDIKGSNLLINNDGVLKIGDFGLANFYYPDQEQSLTSRVVTLWYRAPELLLGATEYGAAIDMWSTGCIIAELFAGKPIMPGRTEVEQMHKIFKLCGSPSEDYWQKTKLPHATSFKPQQPYKRVLAEALKNIPRSAFTLIDKLLAMEPGTRGSATSALRSEFFRTEPLASDPSSLPKYNPSKEMDVRLRTEEARKRKTEAVKGRGPESVRRGSRDSKGVATPEFIPPGQSNMTRTTNNFKTQGSVFQIEPSANTQSTSMVHPRAAGSFWNKNGGSSTSHDTDSNTRISNTQFSAVDLSDPSRKGRVSSNDTSMGYVSRKNRMHYSGPLMPPGGNMEDILIEHERQILQAVRKSRLEKSVTNKKNEVSSAHLRLNVR